MSCVNEKRIEKRKFSLVNSKKKKKNPGPIDLYTFFFSPPSDSKRMVCKHVIDWKDQCFKVHISWVTKKKLIIPDILLWETGLFRAVVTCKSDVLRKI